ncbi:MAG TPA: ABC transporter ATP-binding protein [Polyangiaceae bacterium]
MGFLELERIHKSFGLDAARREVLTGITLSVEKGEFVAIVGYSGAGKTTLISIAAGLLEPDVGLVRLDGREVRQPGPERGVVFQNYSLLPWRTAYENVLLAVERVFPTWPAERHREHALGHLELVGLAAAKDKRPAELSGGMRQRVAVARALAMDPAVLLMDEPLSALDALTRANLQTEMERIFRHSRKTVLLITNDVDEAILLADRIIPLSAGPAATLGPEVTVNLGRPRDRRAINHDPSFKEIRNGVLDFLRGAGAPPKQAVERGLRGAGAPVEVPA